MSNMTIAQALRRVKKLKGSIAEHSSRAVMGVSYMEGKEPAFRFDSEMKILAEEKSEMVDLESRIAVANANNSVLHDGKQISLSKAIRLLQEMKGDLAFMKSLNIRTDTVREREQNWDDNKATYVYTYKEVKYMSDLSEHDRDAAVKVLQNSFEELNNSVEDANHKVLV